MSANLHMAIEGAVGGRPTGPAVTFAGDLGGRERVLRSDDDGVRHGAHFEHEPGLPVGGGNAELQPAALADGERVGAFVATDDGTVPIEDITLLGTDLLGQPPRVSPSGMKQMSWLSGFCATVRPRSAASARTTAFDGVVPSGK